jgi:hypothetical protein
MHFYFDRQHTTHHIRIVMKLHSTHTPTGAGDSAAQVNPYAHFTLCEDGSMIVIAGGMPLCAPTTFESARIVAIQFGLGGHLPIFDAARGVFGLQWPSKKAA